MKSARGRRRIGEEGVAGAAWDAITPLSVEGDAVIG